MRRARREAGLDEQAEEAFDQHREKGVDAEEEHREHRGQQEHHHRGDPGFLGRWPHDLARLGADLTGEFAGGCLGHLADPSRQIKKGGPRAPR